MHHDSIDVGKHIAHARQYYPRNVAYQDASHMENTLGYAEELLEIHRRQAAVSDYDFDESVRLSVAYHKANHHLPHQKFGYATAQEFAAAIAETNLINEMNPTEVERVKDNIIATRPRSLRQTMGEVVTNQAIRGYAAARNYGEFKAWLHHQWQHDTSDNWEEFRCRVLEIGHASITLLRQEFTRAGAQPREADRWIHRKERNLLLLSEDDNPRAAI